MDKVFDWSAPLVAAAARMIQNFLEFLPHLVGAIAVLLIGYLIARTLKALTNRVGSSFDSVVEMLGLGNVIAAGRVNASVLTIIGNLIFWLVLLFFLTSATNLLGLKMFAGWLDTLIGHLPNILSGALIIFAGVVCGSLVADTVRTAAHAMQPRQRALLAQGARLFTIATMIVIGVDQIGINITILITVFAIAIGALLGGVAVAFSLGSKSLVGNLIGARYLSKDYRVGERIRVAGVEGTILELSPVSVVVETADGRVTIPAAHFSDQVSTILLREGQNNAG